MGERGLKDGGGVMGGLAEGGDGGGRGGRSDVGRVGDGWRVCVCRGMVCVCGRAGGGWVRGRWVWCVVRDGWGGM